MTNAQAKPYLSIQRSTLALLLVGCTSTPLATGPGTCLTPGYTPLPPLAATPTRQIDLAFILNNSPAMAVKRDKLNRQFPDLLKALTDPNDGTLPSLRAAFIDGDMGSGGAIAQGVCGPKNGSILGDGGNLQLVGGLGCGVTDPTAHWVQMATLSPANYTGDIRQVLSCVASSLPQLGCNYQQTLRALASSATDLGPAGLPAFLRNNADLGLIIVSDEDDCSALPSDGMFAPAIATETANLRCATRGHQCGGQNLAYPTTGTFTAPLESCTARNDTCPEATDSAEPTSCTPLADIHVLADKVKALKSDPDNMFLVTGISGWPRSDQRLTPPEYKIAPVPNLGAAPGNPATAYDLWPACYDIDHPPSNPDPATGYDVAAAAYGAKPSPRLSAFIDEFGANGLKYSACEKDWTRAMMLGHQISDGALRNHCIDDQLVDADPATVEIDADCIADYFRPKVENPTTPSWSACVAGSGESGEWTRTSIPRCDPAAPVAPCWQIRQDHVKCPLNGQVLDVRTVPRNYTPGGTHLQIQCRVYPKTDAGT